LSSLICKYGIPYSLKPYLHAPELAHTVLYTHTLDIILYTGMNYSYNAADATSMKENASLLSFLQTFASVHGLKAIDPFSRSSVNESSIENTNSIQEIATWQNTTGKRAHSNADAFTYLTDLDGKRYYQFQYDLRIPSVVNRFINNPMKLDFAYGYKKSKRGHLLNKCKDTLNLKFKVNIYLCFVPSQYDPVLHLSPVSLENDLIEDQRQHFKLWLNFHHGKFSTDDNVQNGDEFFEQGHHENEEKIEDQLDEIKFLYQNCLVTSTIEKRETIQNISESTAFENHSEFFKHKIEETKIVHNYNSV